MKKIQTNKQNKTPITTTTTTTTRKKKEEKKRAHLRIEFWENSLPLGYVRKYMQFFLKKYFF